MFKKLKFLIVSKLKYYRTTYRNNIKGRYLSVSLQEVVHEKFLFVRIAVTFHIFI